MKPNEEADTNRKIACKAIRDQAYSAAHAIRALAFNAANAAAKDDYILAATAAAAAAAAAATASAAAAMAAAAIVELNKVDVANSQALLTAKYLADHAYAYADEIYKAAIQKADAQYDANLLAS